jgi:hypothetical protein
MFLGLALFTGYELFIKKHPNKRVRAWDMMGFVGSILLLVFLTILYAIRGLPG